MEKELKGKELEVFGTNEISVKEFMDGSDKSLMLLSNYELAKSNLMGLKDKHEQRVKELVLIEKLSPSEAKELNAIRSELREPRYLIQNIEKNNISTFESYKKADKANLKVLVEINKALEVMADDKIKLEEERKKNEKIEVARIEKEREAKLRSLVDDFETESYKLINSTVLADVDLKKSMLDALVNSEIDYQEFDILFEQARSRVESAWDLKCADIQQKESQRLENERLEKEIAETKRIAELQALRLQEMLPYIAFGESVDLTKLSELDNDSYDSVLSSKKGLFEADVESKRIAQEKLDAEKLEIENKAKAEKLIVAEIRKNRLAEIGFVLNENNVFSHSQFSIEFNALCNLSYISNADAVEFERIFIELKSSVKEAEIKVNLLLEEAMAKEAKTEIRCTLISELGLSYSTEHDTYFVAEDCDYILLIEDIADVSEDAFVALLAECEQVVSDYKKSKQDATLLKKQGKEKQKKFVADKKAISKFIDSLEFQAPVPEIENKEMQELLDNAIDCIKNIKVELQQSLKNA